MCAPVQFKVKIILNCSLIFEKILEFVHHWTSGAPRPSRKLPVIILDQSIIHQISAAIPITALQHLGTPSFFLDTGAQTQQPDEINILTVPKNMYCSSPCDDANQSPPSPPRKMEIIKAVFLDLYLYAQSRPLFHVNQLFPHTHMPS